MNMNMIFYGENMKLAKLSKFFIFGNSKINFFQKTAFYMMFSIFMKN